MANYVSTNVSLVGLRRSLVRRRRHHASINDQWRICLLWKDGAALDVEITDYH